MRTTAWKSLPIDATERIIAATECTAGGKRTDLGSNIERAKLAKDLGRLRFKYGFKYLDDGRPTHAQAQKKLDDLRRAASRFRKAIEGFADQEDLLYLSAGAHLAAVRKTAATGEQAARDLLSIFEPFTDFVTDADAKECFADVRVQLVVAQTKALATAIEHWSQMAIVTQEVVRTKAEAHRFFVDEVRTMFEKHFCAPAAAGLGQIGTEPSPAIRFALAAFGEIKSPSEPALTAGQISERLRPRAVVGRT